MLSWIIKTYKRLKFKKQENKYINSLKRLIRDKIYIVQRKKDRTLFKTPIWTMYIKDKTDKYIYFVCDVCDKTRTKKMFKIKCDYFKNFRY